MNTLTKQELESLSFEPHQPELESFDLIRYWRAIARNKWRILALVAIVGLLAHLCSLSRPPVYRSTATVLVEGSRPKGMTMEELYVSYNGTSRDYYLTQFEIIKSREFAEKLVRVMGLSKHPEFDPRTYELRRAGRTIKLERIPSEVLLLLIENRGQLVSRDQIIERVWGKDIFLDTDNSINAAIRKIRQALKDDHEQPRFVQTITGRGYRFCAEVNEALPDALLAASTHESAKDRNRSVEKPAREREAPATRAGRRRAAGS